MVTIPGEGDAEEVALKLQMADLCQIRPARICALTFVKEDDLPPGQKLLKCSKCKETFYRDRESQTKHWKAHKQTCIELEKDDPKVRRKEPFQSFQELLTTMRLLLSNPSLIKGRLLLVAFKELRYYLNISKLPFFTDQHTKDTMKADGYLADYILSPLMRCLRNRTEAEILWSIPGFAGYFFSNELFIHPLMIPWKRNGMMPPVGDHESYYEDEEELLRKRAFQRGVFYHLMPGYCGVIKILYQFSATDTNSDQWKPRKTPLAAAIVRQALGTFWQCPYTRESFPAIVYEGNDILLNRSEFFFTCMLQLSHNRTQLNPWKRKDELVVGMTAKEFLITILEDRVFYRLLDREGTTLFFQVFNMFSRDFQVQLKSPWSYLTPSDRVEILGLGLNAMVIPPDHDDDIPFKFGDTIVIWTASSCSKIILQIHNELRKSDKLQREIQELTAKLEQLVQNGMARTVAEETIDKENKLLFLDLAISNMREGMLHFTRPLVETYVSCLEPRYRRKMSEEGMKAVQFPREVMDSIAEFSLPQKAPVTFFDPRKPGYLGRPLEED
jgi:hypothetical protein